jgi:hypothetical protein
MTMALCHISIVSSSCGRRNISDTTQLATVVFCEVLIDCNNPN